MTNTKEIVMKMDQAWSAKDETTMRALLHADYHFKGPMMEINGPDESIAMMNHFPFESHNENEELIVQGSKAVHVFDWVVTSPFQATIPMTEVLELEDNRVKNARLFFDTALFPAEVKAQMMSASAA
jgi:limonene-1,2-epoxide hydrolase